MAIGKRVIPKVPKKDREKLQLGFDKMKSKKQYRVVEITVLDFQGGNRDISSRYHCVQVKTRRGWVEYDDSKTGYTGTTENQFQNLRDAIRFKDFLEGKLPERTVKVWDEKTNDLLPEEVFNEILPE